MSAATGKGRPCAGKPGGEPCENVLFGQAQLCDRCQRARHYCQEPECEERHGGIPGQTRYCPPHRAKHRQKPRKANNPPFTEADDAFIREVYAKHNHHEVGPVLRAHWPDRPSWSMSRRAQVLGACTVRKKEPRWSAEEDATLREFAWMVPERLVIKLKEKGYHRTVTGVALRMRRTGTREHIDGLSATGLAKMLDVDGHAVTKWVEDGLLQGERRAGTGGNHDKYYITTAAVQAFLWANPEKVVLSRLERVGSKMWFLDLVSGGRISEHEDAVDGKGAVVQVSVAPVRAAGFAVASPPPPDRTVALYGERVTLTALAEISGRSVQALLHRVDGLGLSVEAAAFDEEELPVDEAPVSPLGVAVAQGLAALMKKHRAKPAHLVEWTGFPSAVVSRMLAGRLVALPPALLAAVEKLDGEVTVTITPKQRSFDPS